MGDSDGGTNEKEVKIRKREGEGREESLCVCVCVSERENHSWVDETCCLLPNSATLMREEHKTTHTKSLTHLAQPVLTDS